TPKKKALNFFHLLDSRQIAFAGVLQIKKTTTVGVIIPDVTNLYFSSLARGIDDIATMYKYNIILANSDQNDQKEVNVLNTLLAKQVDGLIYMGHKITDELRAEFSRSKIPVVLAGTVDPDEQVGSVNIDYEAATEQVVSELVAKGHQRIAFVSGSQTEEPINSIYRMKGYKKALADAGITFDESLIFETEYTFSAGEEIYSKLAEASATAVFVGDDELAVGVLNGALDHDVRVPEEFELVTANNSKLTEMVRPKMSTITQPLYDIGAVSMRLLTKLMNKEEVDEKTIILPHNVANRGTTK
ncbi:MAG: substrate-binding domain-containing protein, partial [Carnobacterium sp.]|uniref:substrate-binding domain-containing protein n=1 Tax=Carnobacterium sp. TaxID=48221 RepID=UPI002FCB57D2